MTKILKIFSHVFAVILFVLGIIGVFYYLSSPYLQLLFEHRTLYFTLGSLLIIFLSLGLALITSRK